MLSRLNILAFVSGTGLLQQQDKLPELTWILGLLLLVIVIGWLRRYQSAGLIIVNNILLWIVFFGLGFLWAAAFAHWRLADSLPSQWERQDIQIIGVIASLPQKNDRSARFQFDVEQVATEGAIVPQRIALSWYKNRQFELDSDEMSQPVMKVGQRWQLMVRLKQPHGNANPHGFDYEVWALERNIRATGYIRNSVDNHLLDHMVDHPSYWIEHVREEIQQRFTDVLMDHTYAGVLKTLATGDQYVIPRDQWQVFIRTGTIHLMAISGLHITLVSSLVFALVFRLWRCNSYLVLRLPARRAAVIAGLIVAFGYAMLSGFAIPAQRSLYMLAVVAIALWRGQFTSPMTVLMWALLWVVLLDPWATIAPGFWLSFGAIAIIMLVTVGRIGKIHWFRGWLRIQWAITLGLIPLLLGLFQQVSLVSPVANAIAIPLVSFVVVPLVLLATIPWFDFLLPLAHEALSVGMTLLQWLSHLSDAVWEQHVPPMWTILVAILGMVWMLLPGSLGLGFFAGFPARWLGVLALLPMFLLQPLKPEAGELWLTVLDVGQGLAVVARTEHHTLLFDTGPSFGESDSGARIIVPFLRGEGVRQLDALIVSHADMDHSGGALSILTAMPVGTLSSSLDHQHPIQQAAMHKVQCRAGQSWQWDDVDFELLHPVAYGDKNSQNKTNANSCVLKITSIYGSVLLPSDIGNKDESALLARAGDKLSATVLIAPHHGSNTSSTHAFIQQVNPALTIFTVGYHNRYDHPREAVVARYRKLGSQLLRSDADGAILLRFTKNGWFADSWRELRRRYWQQSMDQYYTD
ncbi:competence protein ComEC [Nitrosomonas sp. Nm84]|uniref:DNA internalization-related competence protein ComEC/Rec2 n=1 Tax=Nitrosomonas sp. Nm84 TaxID=200124 RepID=UPI000D76F68A|nr:DNA internalization-related competence protein ComEC/Rec2 [Nitrosomonas sp. Nm84]PXW85456.1 competence protein ComEC [Nitrosomonas sp. Nm84]